MSPPPLKIILSASRRTDIPAFYMPWFMEGIERGWFEVKNPYTGRPRTVPATPMDVHTIVFWSKDFGPFLSKGYGELLEKKGYHLFFNFTLNSASPDLEPGVPRLEERLKQLRELALRFSPDAILWRFDPLCFYRTEGGEKDNLGDFERIATAASACGIKRCITSFLDLYPKVRKRAEKAGIYFSAPSQEDQIAILRSMESCLSSREIGLYTCCEKALLDALPPESGVRESSCVPGRLIESLFGPGISLARDKGQRTGCGCTLSTDIGSYAEHPCHHGCLFCYANPVVHKATASEQRNMA